MSGASVFLMSSGSPEFRFPDDWMTTPARASEAVTDSHVRDRRIGRARGGRTPRASEHDEAELQLARDRRSAAGRPDAYSQPVVALTD